MDLGPRGCGTPAAAPHHDNQAPHLIYSHTLSDDCPCPEFENTNPSQDGYATKASVNTACFPFSPAKVCRLPTSQTLASFVPCNNAVYTDDYTNTGDSMSHSGLSSSTAAISTLGSVVGADSISSEGFSTVDPVLITAACHPTAAPHPPYFAAGGAAAVATAFPSSADGHGIFCSGDFDSSLGVPATQVVDGNTFRAALLRMQGWRA